MSSFYHRLNSVLKTAKLSYTQWPHSVHLGHATAGTSEWSNMSHGVEAARQRCPTAQEQVPCTGLVRWRCCPTNCMHSASMNSNADRISPSIPLQVLNVCRTSANPGQPATGHSASGPTEGRTAGPRFSPIAWQGHPLLSSNIPQLA